MSELVRIAFVLFAALPALYLALKKPHWFLVYQIYVIVFNRLLRRLFDYLQGGFQPVTSLSLLPIVVSLPAALLILRNWNLISRPAQSLFLTFVASALYGLLLGYGAGVSAVYEAGEMLSPVLLFAFAAAYRWGEDDTRHFLRHVLIASSLSVAYGWFQYLVMPPWDVMWMNGARMGTIGNPVPLEVRVFSSFPSPGPYAFFLSTVVLTALASRTMLKWKTYPLVMFLTSGLLLTLVRASWIVFAFGFVVFVLKSKSRQMFQMLITSTVLVLLGGSLIQFIPGSDRILDRFETLQSIEDDSSFQARSSFFDYIFMALAEQPLGQGLGQIGNAVRLNSSSAAHSFDNGVFYYMITFGVFFGSLNLIALGLICAYLLLRRSRSRNPFLNSIRGLTAASFPSMCIGLAAVNVLAGTAGSLAWILAGLGLAKLKPNKA